MVVPNSKAKSRPSSMGISQLGPSNVINRVRRNNGREAPICITRATADIDLTGSWIDLRCYIPAIESVTFDSGMYWQKPIRHEQYDNTEGLSN